MTDLKLALVGDLKKHLDQEEKALASGARDAADDVAVLVKTRLRTQVTRAGLGAKVAKTWRHQVYPRRGVKTLEPAALIWTKAPEIIRAFSEGQPIRSSRQAGFLAIPTSFAPSSRRRGARGRRMSMDDFIDVYGQDVLRVFEKPRSRGRVFFAVADKGFRKSKGKRGGSRQVKEGGRSKSEAVLMYVLVRQVRLGKRFDIQLVLRAAEKAWPDALAEHMAKRLES